MTAAMNGAINFSIADGWHPEFCKEGQNSFTILGADAIYQLKSKIEMIIKVWWIF